MSTFTARLIAPPAVLAGAVYAGLVRDTRALPPEAGEAARLNRFPALPYCGLTFLLEGGAELMAPAGHPDLGALPADFVSGPQRAPFASRNTGPMASYCIVFHPQAFEPLTGVSLLALRDRHRPLAEVLPPEWRALAAGVRAAPDDDARHAAAMAWLAPRWAAVRPAGGLLQELPALLRAMPVRAVAAVMGWTTRHLERRALKAHGLTPRELKAIERLHEAVLAAHDDPRPLAELAQAHGFSDQPHMTREWRRLTGVAPAQLQQALAGDDEGWWLYRLRRHGRL